MPERRPPTVALVSLGCPKNLVDSEKILARLAEGGCVVGAPPGEADVIVINTCGFIAPAAAESMEVIREALAHKAAGRARRVVVAGCLVNRQGAGLYEQAPGIDAIVGVNDRDDILAAVTGTRRITRCSACSGSVARDEGRFRLTCPHTAYLRIAEGCSRKCAFCTIPAIRGPFRSKPPQQVLAEARELADDGAVELNVIAQDTTGYGRDLGRGASLASLLRSVAGVPGVEWVRLMYAYPQRFTDELIDVLAACEHVVPYVDVPLQHVSDPLLRRMGRPVTRARIERLLETLRRRVEGLVLRTTFIVGLPGETDRRFDELLAFVKAARFDAMGVFAYCRETGTRAAEMRPQVPEAVKQQRREALMLAQQDIALAANAARVGAPVRVLVDGSDTGGICVGRHYGQAPEVDSICKLASPRPAGGFADGRVVAYDGYDLVVDCGRPEQRAPRAGEPVARRSAKR